MTVSHTISLTLIIAEQEETKKETNKLIENLLELPNDGNKSYRNHRRKVSNHLSREYSQEMKEKKNNVGKSKLTINNGCIENPYKDITESNSLSLNLTKKKKQYFAHTDNNLKGISNLTKDEDLLVSDIDNSVASKNHRNESCSRDDPSTNNCYFYPKKFTKHDDAAMPDFIML